MSLAPKWLRLAFIGLLSVALTGCGPSLTSFTPPGAGAGEGSFTIKAQFADALGVPVHGLVKQDGLVVGQVGDVTASDWHALVTLDLKQGTVVPANTVAGIQQSSPLGEVFVSLDTPANPAKQALAPGSTIPLNRTTGLVAIEDVMALMGTVTNGAALGSLRTIITTIGQALNGHESDVRGALENANLVLQGFAAQRRDLSTLLTRTASFTSQLVSQRGQIARAIENLDPVVRQLAGQTGAIVGLLKKLRTLSKTGTNLARSAGDNMVASLKSAGPVLRELSAQAGPMRKLMDRVSRFAPLFTRGSPGDYTNIDVDVFVKALAPSGSGSIGQIPDLPPGTVPTLPPLGPLTGNLGGLTNLLSGLSGLKTKRSATR